MKSMQASFCSSYDANHAREIPKRENRERENRSASRKTYPTHTAIDYKICPVHKGTFVAGEKEDCLGLLDGFAEAASRKMDLAAESFGGVIAEPVLKQRGTV